MSDDTILRQLERKAIGFPAGTICIFGKDAVQPGGPDFVVRSVEQSIQGVLKLSCAIQPEEGQPDAPHVQIAIAEPVGLKLTADAIEISSARYVRFEELTGLMDAAGVRLSLKGQDRGKGAPGAAALLLQRR